MANYTPDRSDPIGNSYGLATAGETPTPITPNAGGDSVNLIGEKVTLWVVSTGTGATITFDSVRPSDQGQDTNVVLTQPATGVRRVTFDASADRFKQVNAPVGAVNISYTSVVGLTMYAWYTN